MPLLSRRVFLVALPGVVASHVSGLQAASAGPALIMLMRHGEDVGVKGPNLSAEGRARAAALPRLFGSRFPKPDVIVATHASKGSNRPIETVEPLARALHLEIDNRFRDDDWPALAHALLTDSRFAGKVVLVCWHHSKIDNLAKALGVKDAPRWPDGQFDHVWMIDFTKSGRAHMDDRHQQLLHGDR